MPTAGQSKLDEELLPSKRPPPSPLPPIYGRRRRRQWRWRVGDSGGGGEPPAVSPQRQSWRHWRGRAFTLSCHGPHRRWMEWSWGGRTVATRPPPFLLLVVLVVGVGVGGVVRGWAMAVRVVVGGGSAGERGDRYGKTERAPEFIIWHCTCEWRVCTALTCWKRCQRGWPTTSPPRVADTLELSFERVKSWPLSTLSLWQLAVTPCAGAVL